MIVAYDTEFFEDGRTIDLISIGMVREDGAEYYAVNSDAPWDRIKTHDWLASNVLPSLPSKTIHEVAQRGSYSVERQGFQVDTKDTRVKPSWVIANEVRDFVLAGGSPELWADYGAYDHVVLTQLYGPMSNLPEGLPMFTYDLQQEIARTGVAVPEQESGQHNALDDARHVMACLHHLGIVGGH